MKQDSSINLVALRYGVLEVFRSKGQVLINDTFSIEDSDHVLGRTVLWLDLPQGKTTCLETQYVPRRQTNTKTKASVFLEVDDLQLSPQKVLLASDEASRRLIEQVVLFGDLLVSESVVRKD